MDYPNIEDLIAVKNSLSQLNCIPLATTSNDKEGLTRVLDFDRSNVVNLGLLCNNKSVHLNVKTSKDNFTIKGCTYSQEIIQNNTLVGYDFIFNYEDRFKNIIVDDKKSKVITNSDMTLTFNLLCNIPIYPSILRSSNTSYTELIEYNYVNPQTMDDTIYNNLVNNVDLIKLQELLNSIPSNLWDHDDNWKDIGLMIYDYCNKDINLTTTTLLKYIPQVNKSNVTDEINKYKDKKQIMTLTKFTECYINLLTFDIKEDKKTDNKTDIEKFKDVISNMREKVFSKINIYNLYLDWCKKTNISPLSNVKFMLEFKRFMHKKSFDKYEITSCDCLSVCVIPVTNLTKQTENKTNETTNETKKLLDSVNEILNN